VKDYDGYHLLYVEDDDKVRGPVTRGLKIGGYEVTSVPDVTRARIALETFQFDVVVSDWDLGDGGNGGQVYELAKSMQPGLENRFLFVSGTQPDVADHVPWLEKPVWNSKILKTLDELLESRRQIPVRGSAS
jgi:DNA-binding response OmpR family regulator